MNIEEFWRLIENSKRGVDDCDEQSQKLSELLAELEPQEIAGFDAIMRQQLIEAYRWDLWAAAYIINGGCSDDGFEYFRGWLIAQGQDYFEAALKNPEDAAAGVSEGGDVECESILYVANQAYEEKTGSKMQLTNIRYPSEPKGQSWDEDKVEELYPKLAQRFA
jgi:Protein of unknown function (DUF4240)